MAIDYIYDNLITHQDLKYKKFMSSLLPTVNSETIIGVRMPILRKLSKEIITKDKAFVEGFLSTLPHEHYEENILHMLIITNYKDIDKVLNELDKFLPYVDNWAVSDCQVPKVFKNHSIKVLNKVKSWIASNETYAIRYGILVLMKIFLEENYKKDYLYIVADIKSEEYYVNMMRAWFFQEALVKQYDNAIKVFEDKRMDVWTHNQAIKKAIESRKIFVPTKDYLRSLKIK